METFKHGFYLNFLSQDIFYEPSCLHSRIDGRDESKAKSKRVIYFSTFLKGNCLFLFRQSVSKKQIKKYLEQYNSLKRSSGEMKKIYLKYRGTFFNMFFNSITNLKFKIIKKNIKKN